MGNYISESTVDRFIKLAFTMKWITQIKLMDTVKWVDGLGKIIKVLPNGRETILGAKYYTLTPFGLEYYNKLKESNNKVTKDLNTVV
jgi:hypothetical protein